MKRNKQKFDFSGYATKVGLKCSDGRTILPDAFAHMDGAVVPLVYQHLHNDPRNVLGHARLENRKDGVYAYCSLNNTDAGKVSKELVAHGDIRALSIYANQLVEKSKNVMHGQIREVSLVIAGANPEAYIDNLAFAHSDGTVVTDESEAIICAGAFDPSAVVHSNISDDDDNDDDNDDDDSDLAHADGEGKTIADVFKTFTEEQKTVVYALIADVMSQQDGDDDMEHSGLSLEGDYNMKKNLFDRGNGGTITRGLTRDGLRAIFDDAKRSQSTLKNAFLAHGYETMTEALADYEYQEDVLAHSKNYGFKEHVDYLFPDYKSTNATPQFVKRDTEWVAKVFGAAKHVPFSRIKTVLADITADEARARGYVTGNKKIDEVITLLKRTTDPQTVYKKQKLDRDDITDITDFDVVIWLRAEMRMMLEEEIARAILVGDGRQSSDDSKIKEDKIRPIATDDSLYTIKVLIDKDAKTADVIDEIIRGRKRYKGTGVPTFFTTPEVNGDMLLLKDTTGRRLYNTENDLAAGLRAKEIVEVPVMENIVKVTKAATNLAEGEQERLIGISVNMADYSVGADKGGQITSFDDFDIDYNQFKYLIETRCSGALTMPHSAIAFWKKESIPKTS